MKSLFDIVSVHEYHQSLFHNWIRLEKDGIVPKANEDYFVQYSQEYVAFCMKYKTLPDYETILGWYSET